MIVLITAVMAFIGLFVLKMHLRSPRAGHALVINRVNKEPLVSFHRTLVWPIIMRAEEISTAVQTLQVSRSGAEGFYCRDNIKVEATMTFSIRVNPIKEDILRVVKNVGTADAVDEGTPTNRFLPCLRRTRGGGVCEGA